MLPKIKSLALVCLLVTAGTNLLLAQVVATAGINQTICSGNSVVIGGSPTANGGTPPFNYAWSPGTGLSSASVPNPVAEPTITTTYTVTVTDASAHTATAQVTVTVNPSPQVDSITTNNAGCYGSACFYVTGGTLPYQAYHWSNGATGQCITFLSQGVYYVTVVDAHNCTVHDSAVIQPVLLRDSITAHTNVSCFGGSNGVLCVAGIGGTPGYTYNWSNGATGSCITGLVAGTYEVTATDANGCSATAISTITQPSLFTDSISVTNISCNGSNNGMLCILGFGGTPGYVYSWSNSATGSCIAGLSAGTYTVTGTDAYGCTSTASATISQSLTPLHDSVSVTNAACNGVGNGVACLYVTGGLPPYTYNWSDGLTGQCISNIPAGAYNVTVTDNAGCTIAANATVTQPPLINFEITTSGTSVLPDTARIIVTGGTGPYTVNWGNGQNGNIPDSTASDVYDTSGVYGITVIDANHCFVAYTLYVDTAPLLVAKAGVDSAAICSGNSITLGGNPTASGGRSPYTYHWSSGAAPVANPVVTPLAGVTVYTVTVTDAASVTATASVAVTVNQTPTSSFTATGPVCTGQNSSVTYTGTGNAGATYLWNFAGASATPSGGQGPIQADWSTAGTRNITLEVIENGCSSVLTYQPVTVNAVPTSTFYTSSPVCLGQNTPVTYTGTGNAGAVYIWTFDSASIASGSGQGPYQISWNSVGTKNITLTVIENGCTSQGTSQNVVVNPVPVLSVSSDTNICYGQSARLTASGASVYQWSPVTGLNATDSASVVATPAATTSYSVTGANANCFTSALVTVNVSRISDSLVIQSPNCNGGNNGSICAYVTGGLGSYTYLWSNGSNSPCISSLGPGTYTITITDATGCTADSSLNITQPSSALQLQVTPTPALCYGSQTGSLCANVTGGIPPYTYLWRMSIWTNNTAGACLTSVGAGQYWSIVTDANGCSDSVLRAVVQPTQLTLEVFTADTNAIPDSVSLLPAGGTPPYQYNWDNGQTTNRGQFVYTTAGVYFDTITDANGCILTYQVDAGCTDQCVWPGDANYDGVVDNNDILAIGVGYDTTGPARTNPIINFIPQYCALWADTLIGPVNYKHVDCNGDGIINAADTTAIMVNYSLTHVRGGGNQGWKANDPALYITTNTDTIGDTQILMTTFTLGSPSLPVNNAYGVAFTYNFDPLVVDTTSIVFTVGNSWLFGPGNHININKNFDQIGQIQAGITRIDHANRSGNGPIATVSMKITTGNINGKNLQYYLMHNFISNLTLIDSAGNVLGINAGDDTVQIGFTPTAITPVNNPGTQIRIFPNPANDQLNVVSSLSELEEITIFDLAGREVIHQNMQAGNYSAINTSELSAGVYMITIKTADQDYHSRFVKAGNK